MLIRLQPYRHWVFGLLLLTYMSSSIGKNTVEVLHLISHIPDILFAKEVIHSFEAHSQDTHQHNALEKINDITDNNEEAPCSPNTNDLKKKVEISEIRNFYLVKKLSLKPTYPAYTFSRLENFKQVPKPPPRLHIFQS